MLNEDESYCRGVEFYSLYWLGRFCIAVRHEDHKLPYFLIVRVLLCPYRRLPVDFSWTISLPAIAASPELVLMSRSSSRAQFCRRHWLYGHSKAPFSWISTFETWPCGILERNNEKGWGKRGPREEDTTGFHVPSKAEACTNTTSLSTLKRVYRFWWKQTRSDRLRWCGVLE